MNAADIRPVAPADQTQSTLDLFLIFVGANVVATTFQVGASLAAVVQPGGDAGAGAVGSVAGAALVAALAPLGPRLRVPSVIAARPALGIVGAGLVAVVLYVTNFAWIALNNVIAASACARVAAAWIGPSAGSQTAWAVALGLLATLVVWRRAAGGRARRSDRRAGDGRRRRRADDRLRPRAAGGRRRRRRRSPMSWWRGLDVVIGYQVSWILMFADYSRYTRSVRGSAVAVFARPRADQRVDDAARRGRRARGRHQRSRRDARRRRPRRRRRAAADARRR